MIGITGATIDFFVFMFLSTYLSVNYRYANIISVSLGLTNNFLLNSLYNFKKTDKLFFRFLSFYIAGILGLGISAGLLFLLVEKLSLNILFSKSLIIIIVAIIQFNINRVLAFRNFKGNEGIE